MWTKSQETAINAVCADNLVSAAAGSGKTAVMVQRIVDRVLSGQVDIDKLLVVTFTNAAASELKSRLMKEIMDALNNAENPDYLNRQLVLINNASICTIDSFCLEVLRNNFYKAGLDPSFKIGDSAELELMKEDILKDIFDEYYEKDDYDFLNLVDCLTTKSDDELLDIIKKIIRYTDSLPDGVNCLRKYLFNFVDSSSWEDEFINYIKKICENASYCYSKAISYCSFSDEAEKLRLFLLEEKNYFDIIKSAKDWNHMKYAVDSVTFARISFPKSIDDTDKAEIKKLRDTAKDIFKEVSNSISGSYKDIIDDIGDTHTMLSKLVEIAELFTKRFKEQKAEKALVDFVDVEHITLNLLRDENGNQSELAKQLMNKYSEIYIDEYQDCNEVQEMIFSLVSGKNQGKPNMFMVGDMKQSIYGFRGSQPKLFKDKADRYPAYTEDGKYNKIILNKNFRSRKAVIDAVNSVFSQIMTEECGELNYTEDEYLYVNEGAYENTSDDINKVDIVLFETNPNQSDEENDEIKKTEAEAIYTANRIKEYISSKHIVYDKGEKNYRSCKYSDIVILLRSGGEKAQTYNRILTLAGIPAYCESSGEYYSTPEIAFLVNYLKIIDNPLDDVALLSVMRHPVFGFNENDFVAIRLCKPKGYFCNSLKMYLKEHDDFLAEKLNDFINTLGMFYDKSLYLPADKLIWEIIRHTDYMSYLSFMPNAELKKNNVNALLTRAYEFEKTSYKGIFDFIRYIDKLKSNNSDVEQARILSDDEDVVRIMTIHKSKGLEFPIVFLGDCGKKFNDSDITREKILIHNKLGFGSDYYNAELRYHYELPQKKLIKLAKKNELLSEEMRVLYVALTRAREKLIITASLRNLDAHIEKLCIKLNGQDKILSPDTVSSVSTYIDWILLGSLRNKNIIGYNNSHIRSMQIDDGAVFELITEHKDQQILQTDSLSELRTFDTLAENADFTRKICDILDYEYPHKHLSDIPSNMSVTELKKLESDDDTYNYFNETILTVPSFCTEEKALSPMERGTLIHLVMEKLDFSTSLDYDDISRQINLLSQKGYFPLQNMDYINIDNIVRILNTNLGMQMRKYSCSLKREFEFKYLMNAKEMNPLASDSEKIVVQGMVDVYFETENGEIIIADYKTDKVNNIDELVSKYRPQLNNYKMALEKALGKKVTKKYLVFIENGETVEC